MIDSPLPLTEAELHLKQIRQYDLNDLGKAVMAAAFAGFLDDNRPSPEAVETHLAEMRALTGFANHQFDPRPYRRFAGDSTLPRSRFYTIAATAHGNDGGTLVRELRSYYNPRNAGIVPIFDTTAPGDKQMLGYLPSKDPSLHSPSVQLRRVRSRVER